MELPPDFHVTEIAFTEVDKEHVEDPFSWKKL